MKAVQSCQLLVGLALLAGCSERSAMTAPSARPLAATASLVDRPYTWSLKCSGDGNSSASWSWTAGGAPIAGTEMSATCSPSTSPISGAGIRPAAVDGFSACVDGTCDTWTFDPAAPFKVQLKGTYKWCEPNWTNHGKPCVWFTSTATLNVDS